MCEMDLGVRNLFCKRMCQSGLDRCPWVISTYPIARCLISGVLIPKRDGFVPQPLKAGLETYIHVRYETTFPLHIEL